MEHSFNTEIAKKYGISAAIILKHLHFWVEHNRANERHFHDGYFWTYNSVKAFCDLFDYMTKSKINTALSKLEEDGIIVTGNYNDNPWDKTKWYAITEKGLSLLGEDSEVDSSFSENEFLDCPKIGNHINNNILNNNNLPDVNTYSNNSIAQTDSDESSKQPLPEPLADVLPVILNTGEEWFPTVKEYEKYKQLYPGVSIDTEFRKMNGWCDANPRKRKTKMGVKRFVNGWLSKEQDSVTRKYGSDYKAEQTKNDNKFVRDGVVYQ